MFILLLPSATQLRQGFVFTAVCDSVHWGGMYGRGMHDRGSCMAGGHVWQEACMLGDMYGRGVCMAGGMQGRGHVWQGASMTGDHAWQGGMYGKGMRGGEGGMRGRRDGQCSRRYASYWNAFMFRYLIILWYAEDLIEIVVCCLIFSN